MNIYNCDYGCGQIAIKQNKSGKWLCANSQNSCPEIRKKNSKSIKLRHQEGKIPGWNKLVESYGVNRGWNKGLSKFNHPSILKQSEKLKGKVRKIESEEKSKYLSYRSECMFIFEQNIIQFIEGYELLKMHGMYHKTKNKDGVVRDHKISIWHGWINKIPSSIISHPANCEFIRHKDNAAKGILSSINLQQLYERIEEWDSKLLLA